jgi:hypothetical protein
VIIPGRERAGSYEHSEQRPEHTSDQNSLLRALAIFEIASESGAYLLDSAEIGIPTVIESGKRFYKLSTVASNHFQFHAVVVFAGPRS